MMPKSHAYSESWILCKLLTYLSVASCPWKKAPTSLSRASFKRPLPELLSFKPLGNPTHPLSHTNPIIKMAQLLILPYYLILIFSYVKQWEPGGSRPLSAVECVNVATWYCTYALWYSVLPAESRKSEVPTWISRPWVIVQHTALAKEFFIQRSSPSPLSQELQDKIWGHCEPSPDVAWNKSLCNGDSQKLHLHPVPPGNQQSVLPPAAGSPKLPSGCKTQWSWTVSRNCRSLFSKDAVKRQSSPLPDGRQGMTSGQHYRNLRWQDVTSWVNSPGQLVNFAW